MHMHQVVDAPDLHLDIDQRARGAVGLDPAGCGQQWHLYLAKLERRRATELLARIPKMGITYAVAAAQTPQYSVDSISTLSKTRPSQSTR